MDENQESHRGDLRYRLKKESLHLSHDTVQTRRAMGEIQDDLDSGTLNKKLAAEWLLEHLRSNAKVKLRCENITDLEVRQIIERECGELEEEIYAISTQFQLPLAELLKNNPPKPPEPRGR